MKALVFVLGMAVLTTGCASPSLGRLPPVMPSELASMDSCEKLKLEMQIASEFCDHVSENKGYDDSDKTLATATSFVPIVGAVVWAGMQPKFEEMLAATKSASIRQAQLAYEYESRNCPAFEGVGSCPPLCQKTAFDAVLSMENGWWGEKCVTLNRQERNTYRDLLGLKTPETASELMAEVSCSRMKADVFRKSERDVAARYTRVHGVKVTKEDVAVRLEQCRR